MMQVTFAEIVRALDDLQSTVPAAESHGCLCGALCVAGEYSLERWLDEIVSDDAAADAGDDPAEGAGHGLSDGVGPLKLLFEDTVRVLRGDEMEFQLLLPDDEVGLAERATALSQWCQGFLFGFGLGGVVKTDEMPPNVDEVLSDIAQIGRASVDVNEADETQEDAYMEVTEYLRVGVQLIHDEFVSARADKPARSQLN
jgi:uncharacterized protein YgfB (UPF0149 family)